MEDSKVDSSSYSFRFIADSSFICPHLRVNFDLILSLDVNESLLYEVAAQLGGHNDYSLQLLDFTLEDFLDHTLTL